MTLHDDEQLAAFLNQGPERGPSATLDQALDKVRPLPQRPAWLVTLSGGTITEGPASSLLRFSWIPLVVAAILALVVGGLVLGGWLQPRPAPLPPVPFPSPSAQAFLWSTERMGMDWPLPVRHEPSGPPTLVTLVPALSGRPEDPRRFTDPSSDIDPLAPGWVDLTEIEVRYATGGENSASRIEFDLATRFSGRLPHPQERWMAYGMVVDLDGDGVGDLRLGMDNAPSGRHRAWRTDLSTDVTSAQTGYPYGMVGNFYFDTFLPGEKPLGRMLVNAADMGEFKFYVWASLIEDGRMVATDYAPDAGWFDLTE